MGRIKLIVSLLWMSVCESEVALYGHIQPPMYPEPYSDDLHLHWNLRVPHGYRIQLTFNHLDIEPSANCSKDSLTVFNGEEILGMFCGQKSTDTHHPGNKNILSPGNHIRLVFKTDNSNPGPQMHLGFFVFYQTVAVDCGIPKIPNPDLMFMTEGPLTTYKQNISFKCQSEYYQLIGDAQFTCDASGSWISESGQIFSQNASICVPVCGRPTVDLFRRGRVLGGKDAPAGSFPWQVFLTSGVRGGAMVIGEKWLMTAAHSLEKVKFAKEKVKME